MKNKNRIRLVEGMNHIRRDKKCMMFPFLYAVLLVVSWMILKPILPKVDFGGVSDVWFILLSVFMAESLLIGEMAILIALGTPLEARRIEEALKRIRIRDEDGNPPMLLSKEKKGNVTRYKFFSAVLSREDFINRIPNLRAILKAEIEKDWITEGDDPRYVIVETISAKKNFLT